MNLRRFLAGAALAATSLAAGALALDRLFPPDLSRYHERSSETVDANGRLLRAFTTADGKWRLKTTVDDVDPVYLALLKAYEDRRFDDHWGVDPLAAVRAAGQWIARGRIVSGASTISMQAARLLEPRPRGLLTKAIQSARALQLEWRYSKREVLAIYLTLAPMGGNLEGVRAASFAYFGKEPRQLSRRRGGSAGRHPAIARAAPARTRRQSGAGRPRSRAGARAGARHHRPGHVRQGGQPARARSKARHAHAGAAPGGVARRPVARCDRSHDGALRIARRARPARGRGARPVRRPGTDRPGRDRQSHGRRRGLAGRLGLLRPRRPGRSGALASLARLGAEASDLCHGLRRPRAASGVAGRGRAGALPRLAAAQLRPRAHGRRHRAPRPPAIAERAGRAGAREGRAAALPLDPAHRRRHARPAAGRCRRHARHCPWQRVGLAAGDGRALCRAGQWRQVRAARRAPRSAPAASRCN